MSFNEICYALVRSEAILGMPLLQQSVSAWLRRILHVKLVHLSESAVVKPCL